jgi:hypothetical protein
MPSPLTIITTYYNFNNNPWMEQNTRHCARQWRRAGAHVILVEFNYEDSAHASPTSSSSKHSGQAAAKRNQAPLEPVSSFSFHPDVDQGPDPDRHVCDTLLQHTVNDIMWYKEMGVNIALPHLPSDCSLVGIFDNDILFVPPPELQQNMSMSGDERVATGTGTTAAGQQSSTDATSADEAWWMDQIVRLFAQSPMLSILQPFQQVALTTESVRTSLLGVPPTTSSSSASSSVVEGSAPAAASPDTTEPPTEPGAPPPPPSPPLLSLDDACDRCERMMRVRPSVLRDRQNGVVGCAWVVRRHILTQVPLFAEAVTGGGEALMLNMWLGAVSTSPHGLPVCGHHDQQKYYFSPTSTFARAIRRHHKRLARNVQLPLHGASLPLTLVHLYHGELATKRTHNERFHLLRQRRFQCSRDLIAHPSVPGLLRWSDALRASGINSDLRSTFERSHSVREKALLRMAKVRRCMDTLKAQVTAVVSTEKVLATQEGSAHAELSHVMRKCLRAFPQ